MHVFEDDGAAQSQVLADTVPLEGISTGRRVTVIQGEDSTVFRVGARGAAYWAVYPQLEGRDIGVPRPIPQISRWDVHVSCDSYGVAEGTCRPFLHTLPHLARLNGGAYESGTIYGIPLDYPPFHFAPYHDTPETQTGAVYTLVDSMSLPRIIEGARQFTALFNTEQEGRAGVSILTAFGIQYDCTKGACTEGSSGKPVPRPFPPWFPPDALRDPN